jgi:hypothetical protein
VSLTRWMILLMVGVNVAASARLINVRQYGIGWVCVDAILAGLALNAWFAE